jgi:hypothetical protein
MEEIQMKQTTETEEGGFSETFMMWACAHDMRGMGHSIYNLINKIMGARDQDEEPEYEVLRWTDYYLEDMEGAVHQLREELDKFYPHRPAYYEKLPSPQGS